MIPVLFESTTTSFTTNGIGRLSDAVSCEVTEERNGKYELVMEYPQEGIHFEGIAEEKIVLAKPYDGALTPQPFRIYRVTKPLKGVVTVYASHISYDLRRNTVLPFSGVNIQDTFAHIAGSMVETNNFTFYTDKTSSSPFTLTHPVSARGLLGGSTDSLLYKYGGEYEFDGFTVKLLASRGVDNGVTIRYGKNLTALKKDTDTSDVYTGVIPYWTDGENYIYGGVVYSEDVSEYPYHITVPLDLSSYFEEAPTVAQLEAKAADYLDDNDTWNPSSNIDISFVALWQTEEYKDIAVLERVKLCDYVTVEYPRGDISVKAKVIKTVYDTLLERYTKIELGSVKQNTLAQIINTQEKQIEGIVSDQSASIQRAVSHATELITGGLGGHVVISQNADGEPEEILIMDTDDKETATNVIRLNRNGLGFSTTGYDGTYTNAWTIDGNLVADFITTGTLDANEVRVVNLNADNITSGYMNATRIRGGTIDASQVNVTNLNASNITSGNLSANYITSGTMSADRIYGGTLTLGGSNNQSGVARINDASGNQVIALNNNGITINKGSVDITQNDYNTFIKLTGTSSPDNYMLVAPHHIIMNGGSSYQTVITNESITNVNNVIGQYVMMGSTGLSIGLTNSGASCNFNFNQQANNRLVVNCSTGIYADELRGAIQNVGYVRIADLFANMYIRFPDLFQGIIE